MKEKICELICSLCGRAIEPNISGNYRCSCEDSYRKNTFPNRIIIYKRDINIIGCPMCLSSQIVLPRNKDSPVYESSHIICRNPECSLYSLDNVKTNGVSYLYYGNFIVCGIKHINDTISVVSSYDGAIIAKLLLKEVAERLLNKNLF